jgi:hypothetical protein
MLSAPFSKVLDIHSNLFAGMKIGEIGNLFKV